MNGFSRRRFFHLAGTLEQSHRSRFRLNAQQQYPPPVAATPIFPYTKRSPVSLVKGDVRRKNVFDALMAVDREVRPAMSRKKYVLMKINNVSTTTSSRRLMWMRSAASWIMWRRGSRAPWSSPKPAAGTPWRASRTSSTPRSSPNSRPRRIKILDLNREKKFEMFAIVDRNIRPTSVRLAAQLMDPDAFVISAAMLKTHNAVVATGSVKNMVLGAPLHSLANETPVFADKHLMHAMPLGKEKIGVNDCHHAMNYNMAILALHLRPNWGVAVIDGFDGMEGNGPVNGTRYP